MYNFPETPENFDKRAIERPILESTGLPEGDDEGFDQVPVNESGERLVGLGEYLQDQRALKADYDDDPATGLPGGFPPEKYVRESVAIAVRTANDFLEERYGQQIHVGVVEALRTYVRQSAGFTKKVMGVLAGDKKPGAKKLYEAGMRAKGSYTWTRVKEGDRNFSQFLQDIAASPETRKDLVGDADPADTEKIVKNFGIIQANIAASRKFFPDSAPNVSLNVPVEFDYQNNPHAGGGAIDAMLYDGEVPISSPVPMGWMDGPEAAIEYMETEENREAFQRKVLENSLLQGYLTRMGINPLNITQANWDFIRGANRIFHGVMKGVGATYYSAANPTDGGENWHWEPGNVVRNPANGKFVHMGKWANRYFNSGNPGHALQRMPKGKATAVWGGIGGHEQLKRMGLLG